MWFQWPLHLTANLPVPYLLTISLRIRKEPLMRMRASWREPYNGVPLIFTSSSPVLIFWDKAALPPSSICVTENKRESSWGEATPYTKFYFLVPPNLIATSSEGASDGSQKLQDGFQIAAEKLITSHYLLKAKFGQALKEGGNTLIIQSLPLRNSLSI